MEYGFDVEKVKCMFLMIFLGMDGLDGKSNPNPNMRESQCSAAYSIPREKSSRWTDSADANN
jgi:hypothetical protein